MQSHTCFYQQIAVYCHFKWLFLAVLFLLLILQWLPVYITGAYLVYKCSSVMQLRKQSVSVSLIVVLGCKQRQSLVFQALQQHSQSQLNPTQPPSCPTLAKVSIPLSSVLPSFSLMAYLMIINPESNRDRPVRDWWPRRLATPVLLQGSQLPNYGQILLPRSPACWCQRQTQVLPSGLGVLYRATLWPQPLIALIIPFKAGCCKGASCIPFCPN